MSPSSKIIAVLCVFVESVVGEAYPFVQPTKQECKDMMPSNFQDRPQQTNRTFTIKVTDNIYQQTAVKVTIERRDNFPIKGLILQARRAQCDVANQTEPVGTFYLDGEKILQLFHCSRKDDSVVNRAWMSIERNLEVHWSSNNIDFGRVYFIATIVATDKLYWTDVTSEIIRHLSDTDASTGEVCPASTSRLGSSSNRNNAAGTLLLFSCVMFYFTL
ncbi:putative defense protein [Mytilus edulis]|uniref:putative defense protein n=1 Tax=Mytilus edulis TaxID=6550 RepID=UPI0039F04617